MRVVVVGAGIVGLATARALQRRDPRLRVTVVDKEPVVAAHQTGRNSGVVHAGVYYRPGSAKAQLCTDGRARLLAYCRERGIAHQVCGKLVVATSPDELARLTALEERCIANGVAVERVGLEGLRAIEPNAAGIAGLRVAETAIVDFAAVARAIADDVVAGGGALHLGVSVTGAHVGADEVVVETTAGPLHAEAVVTCAGLHSDQVARAFGTPVRTRIVPFRGEYYELAASRTHLVRGLIYPVPDPRFPFLGVHLTRGIDGHVHAGPNAVLALAREGYSWRKVHPGELIETLRFPGFRRLARRYWRTGLEELWRSASRAAFARAVARLVPAIEPADLIAAPAGVRAQAVTESGQLVEDFAFEQTDPRVVHVVNAPSPAATASFAIGEVVADRLGSALGWASP